MWEFIFLVPFFLVLAFLLVLAMALGGRLARWAAIDRGNITYDGQRYRVTKIEDKD